MPDLERVTQEFTAETGPYLAALQAATAAAREFAAANTVAAASVEGLQRAIDGLEGKTVRVAVDFAGLGGAGGAAKAAEGLAREYDAVAEAVTRTGEASSEATPEITRMGEAWREAASAGIEAAQALKDQEAASGRVTAETVAAALAIRGLADEELANAQAGITAAAALREQADAAQAVARTRDAFNEMAARVMAAADAQDAMARAMARTRDGLAATAALARAAAVSEAQADFEAALARHELITSTIGVIDAMKKADQAAAASAHTFRIWGTGVALTGNALHWIIAGSAELLAVAVPALVAMGAAAGAAAEGATWVADRMQAVYTSTEATSAMLGETAGQALGLKSALQGVQTASDPLVYEAFGAVINGLKQSFSGFWKSGQDVLDMFDRFAAHLDIQGFSQLQAAISHMVPDLIALGEVLGNVGHALLSLATTMPGLAEVLLGVLAGFTRLLNLLLQPAWYNFGGHLITIVTGLEEAGRWGGLFLRVIGPMVSGLGNLIGTLGYSKTALALTGAKVSELGDSMSAAGGQAKTLAGSVRMLFTTGWGWAILGGLALGGLALALSRTKTAAQEMASGMQSAIASATPAQGLVDIIQDLPKLQAGLNQASAAAANFHGAGRGAGEVMGMLDQNVSTLKGTMAQMVSQMVSVLTMTTRLDGRNFTLAQSIGMASAAGVDMGHMFQANGQLTAIAKQQIDNLIQGYRDMAGTGTVLAADINAVNVQALVQQTQVQKLNSAWDSFISTVTGGTQALGALNSDLITIGNVTVVATSKITAFAQGSQGMQLSVSQVAKALTSFGGTSAQVWQNYDSAVQQAQQVTDWLRTAASEGAITAAQFGNSIKGVVAELLPYAADSRTAQAVLSALAQEATGTAMNYSQLKTWVGNTDAAQKALNSTVATATQYMSNLGQVAANLASSLNNVVDSAIANGAVNIKGITTATQNFTTSLRQNGTQSQVTRTDLQILTQQLYAAHTGASNAASIIYQLGVEEGLTSQQARRLASETAGLYQQLVKTQGTYNVKLNVTGSGDWSMTTGTVAGGGGHHLFGAAGMRVPGGYGGGDRVPIMAEPGEAVVPKHLVHDIAPFLSAHRVPGFASGGIVPSYSGTIPGLQSWTQSNVQATTQAMFTSMARAIAGAIQQLITAGSGGGGGSTGAQSGSAAANIALGMKMAAAYGWTGAQFTDLVKLWNRESGWSATAANPTSDARGIAQNINGWSSGYQYGNAAQQIAWGLRYILGRYGSPAAAWGHELALGWYDQGGYLPPGLSLALNTTGRPEAVGNPGGPVTIVLQMDGRRVAKAVLPSLVSETGRYGIRNSGRVTGTLRPG